MPAGGARAAADAIAAEIVARGPLSVREAKRLLDASIEIAVDEGLAAELEASVRIFASDDMLEGAHAFLDKREPRYEGR